MYHIVSGGNELHFETPIFPTHQYKNTPTILLYSESKNQRVGLLSPVGISRLQVVSK
jgi:hypothetical protein